MSAECVGKEGRKGGKTVVWSLLQIIRFGGKSDDGRLVWWVPSCDQCTLPRLPAYLHTSSAAVAYLPRWVATYTQVQYIPT